MWYIKYYKSLESTNDTAKQLAREGAPHGTVVTAEEQTAGRGQYGRTFHSPEGGLYFSVILRPGRTPEGLSGLTQRAGVAVCRAVGLGARIKPVNDVRINGRKLCGILTETASTGNRTDFAVIGIGVNIAPLGIETDQPVTSLEEESGRSVDKYKVLQAILSQMENIFEIDMKEYEGLKER